jgi:hypothetical protein
MEIPDLTPFERKVQDAFPCGRDVEFSGADGEKAEQGQSWGLERSIRAEVLHAKASALADLGQYVEALTVIDSGPDSYQNYTIRSVVLERLGRSREAAVTRRIVEEAQNRGRGGA